MWNHLEIVNQVLFILISFLLSIIFVAYLVLSLLWLIFSFIKKGNSKNRYGGEYLEAIFRQEKYHFKIKITKVTMRYFNVKYYKQEVNIKTSDYYNDSIFHIYNCLTYVAKIKWKQNGKGYVFFIHLANFMFIFALLCYFGMIILFLQFYSQDLISITNLNLISSTIGYTSLVVLILGWTLWVYFYELMRKDILLLAEDYLNEQEYERIRKITLIKTIIVGSDSLFIFTF
ncbi:hypothetical protein [Spiroplasma endosymbiont of Eupeodes luniger]|uniref:hypothetical protein n=1 Tax=Spiroplasma endosymbiont of Eupeodes luniger TaxID=3066300 RepID=UPI0030CC5381